jgi:cellulose synthase/poly-beta-1,6-N-acetylglucosamine synthase-like glycosyltransferase
MIGIMIPVYDRPEYFQQTINSLLASNLDGCMICIVDDGSTNEELKRMYRFFIVQHIPMIKIVNEHVGMWNSMRVGFDTLLKYGCTSLINLDSDTIVKPDWVIKMKAIHDKYPNALITGFNNCRSVDKVVIDLGDCYQRESSGGVSQMYSKDFYLKYVRPNLTSDLWDWDVNRAMRKDNILCYSTKPSVVQHIGIRGKNTNPSSYDVAKDF